MNNSDKLTSSEKANTNTAAQNKMHSVVIIGDSHARGCTTKVKGNLNDNFVVNGFVKPDACIDMVTSTINGNNEQLTKRDAVVFWGGTNDIGKDNSQNGLRHLVNFVKNNSHTNIIVINVPHRHDLVNWSCVNREVRMFNRKLVKHMKVLKHVTVMV
jgi:hypothetical protein